MKRRLEDEGLQVQISSFRAPGRTLYDGPPLIGFLLILLTAGVIWGPASWRPVEVFLEWVALLPLVGELLAIPANLDLVLGKKKTENLEAEITGSGPGRVVLVAHHDTQWGSPLFHPRFLPFVRAYFLVAYACFFGLPVLSAADMVWHLPWAHALLAPLAAIFLVLLAFLRYAAAKGRHVVGANDNGSGVAVATAVALRIREAVKNGDLPKDAAKLTLFLPGAEEVGERGMLHWLRVNRPDHHATVFINIDNVGGGKLRFLRGEGMLLPLKYSPPLLRIAEEVSSQSPEDLSPGYPLLLPTDMMWAVSMGYAGITFIAQEDGGAIPNYHWHTDTIDRVSPDHMKRVEETLYQYTASVWRAAEASKVGD